MRGFTPASVVEESWDEFGRIVNAVLVRSAWQTAQPIPPNAEWPTFVAQLRGVIERRGLPRPLSEGEPGQPGGMSETECAPLVAQVVFGMDEPWLTEVARQFVKACFYPEFRMCRDSYREVGRDGACRRQEVERARRRISGAHCVDCPHWVALAPDEHVALLAREWRTNGQAFLAYRDVFLPEDFRELRRWLHAAARRGLAPLR